MVSIARRNLFREKGRFAVSVGGVAFSVVLMLFLLGAYEGVLVQSRAYILNSGADVWVTEEGITDMFTSASILDASLQDDLAQVPGVAEVYPILARAIHVKVDGRPTDLFLIGYDPDSGIGGPWRFEAGARSVAPGTLLLDHAFANKHGLEVGDEITILGQPFPIVGVTRDASTLLNQFGFVTLTDAQDLISGPDIVNFFLLRVAVGWDPGQVARAVESRLAGVHAYPSPVFAENNTELLRDTFLPILYAILVIGVLIGLIVVGLTIYTATVEKTQEYGVLKALGAGTRNLALVILEQALWSSLVGYVVGAGVAWLLGFAVAFLIPAGRFEMTALAYLLVFAAAVLIALAASALPLRRVSRLDPADVFRV